MTDPDHDLRTVFAQQRKEDGGHAPVFQHQVQRAMRRPTKPTNHVLRWCIAGGVAALIGILALLPISTRPAPSLAESLPVLLPQATEPNNLFSSVYSSTPSSDFLLPFHLKIDVL